MNSIARSLAVSAENQDLDSGSDSIPNPLNSQIKDLKSKYEILIRAQEREFNFLLEKYAKLANVDPKSLSFLSGEIVKF